MSEWIPLAVSVVLLAAGWLAVRRLGPGSGSDGVRDTSRGGREESFGGGGFDGGGGDGG